MKTVPATAVVVPLRPEHAAVLAAAPAAPEPKVFNASFVQRLQALNDASRWLRNSGHSPTSVHLQGELPMIQVDARAAALLVAESHGYNARPVDKDTRMCSVILKGCAICWYEAPKN
jgi:hypothetical protein